MATSTIRYYERRGREEISLQRCELEVIVRGDELRDGDTTFVRDFDLVVAVVVGIDDVTNGSGWNAIDEELVGQNAYPPVEFQHL